MKINGKTVLLISTLILLTFGIVGLADIIDVPDDYFTIQEAVNNADPGDTIAVHRVETETYEENVSIIADSLYLTGSWATVDGRGATVFDNSGSYHTEMEYFKIMNGEDGIYLENTWGNSLHENKITQNSDAGIKLAESFDSNNKPHNKAANIVEENYIYDNQGSGIKLYNYKSVSILFNDNYIHNNQNEGVNLVKSDDNNFWYNDVLTNGDNGFGLYNSNDNQIYRNDIKFNYDDGVYLSESDHNYFGYNDVWDNGDNGLGLYHSDGNDFVGNVIKGTSSSSNNGEGVYMSNSGHNYFVENEIYRNAGDGVYLSESDHNYFGYDHSCLNDYEGNEIYGNDDRGVYLSNSDYNHFVGNEIWDNAGEGIYLNHSDHNDFEKNTIWSNDGEGIYMSSSHYNDFVGNEFYVNANEGVYINNSDYNDFEGNEIYENQDDGVHVSYSYDNYFGYNYVWDNGHNGFGIYNSDDNDLVGNTIGSTGGAGVYMSNSGGNDFEGNEIHENDDEGVYLIYSNYNHFVRNEIQFNADHGVYVEGSNHNYFVENEIRSNTGDGVYLEGSQFSDFEGNEIYSNYYRGIFMEGSDYNNVRINEIYNNDSDGVAFWGSDHNLIWENTILNNGARGIRLGVSYHNTVIDNIVEDNKTGILLEGGSKNNDIKRNSIIGNDEYGISLGSSYSSIYDRLYVGSTLIEDNLIDGTSNGTNSTDIGIYLKDSSDTKVSKNTVVNNEYGISVQGEVKTPNITNNIVSNNSYGIHVTTFDSAQNPFFDNNSGLKQLKVNLEQMLIRFEGGLISPEGYAFALANPKNMDEDEITIKGILPAFFPGLELTLKGSWGNGWFEVKSYEIDNPLGTKIHSNSVTNNTKYGVVINDSDYNTITKNTIADNKTGILLEGGSKNNDITDNTIIGNSKYGISLIGSESTLIEDNLIDGTSNGTNSTDIGIYLKDSSDTKVSKNTVVNNEYGISVRGEVKEPNITKNIVSNNRYGIHVTTFDSEQNPPVGTKIHYNSVINNTKYGVVNRDGTHNLDATLNWWGFPSGPSGQGSGNGDAVSTKVIFAPWLGVNPDSDPNTPGVQVKSPLTFVVDDVGPTPSNGYFDTAIYASNARPGTDTVIVSHGTYTGSEPITDSGVILSETGSASNTYLNGDISIDSSGVTLGGPNQGFTITGDITVGAGVRGTGTTVRRNALLGTFAHNGTGTVDTLFNNWGEDGPEVDGNEGSVLYSPWLYEIPASTTTYIVDDVGAEPAGSMDRAIADANTDPDQDSILVNHGAYVATQNITSPVEILSEEGSATSTFLAGDFSIESSDVILGTEGRGFTINGDVTIGEDTDAGSGGVQVNRNILLGSFTHSGSGIVDALFNNWNTTEPKDTPPVNGNEGSVLYSPWILDEPGTENMTYVVDDVGADPGGSLNRAIDDANNDSDRDTVVVNHGTYTTDQPVTESVEIISVKGSPANTFINGDTMNIDASDVTLGKRERAGYISRGFTVSNDITVGPRVDASTVHLNWNNLYGFVTNKGNKELDATYNWWGDTDPSDDTEGAVDYDPWLPKKVGNVLDYMEENGLDTPKAAVAGIIAEDASLSEQATAQLTGMGLDVGAAGDLLDQYGTGTVLNAMNNADTSGEFAQLLNGFSLPAGAAGGLTNNVVAGGAGSVGGKTVGAVFQTGETIEVSFPLADFEGDTAKDLYPTVSLVSLDENGEKTGLENVSTATYIEDETAYVCTFETTGLTAGYYQVQIDLPDRSSLSQVIELEEKTA